MKKLQPLPAIDAGIMAEDIQLPCAVYLAAKGCKTLRFSVSSLAQASKALTSYRDLFNLGASDLKRNCGNVYGADGKTVVAHISYNGRAWSADGKTLLEERPA